MPQFKYTWRNRDIEELGREELLKVCRESFHQLDRERKMHQGTLDMMDVFTKAEKALAPPVGEKDK